MPKISWSGQAARVEILEDHFRAFGPMTAATAWRFVYEELLWFDRSTGLAHLYESDKVRPDRSLWYPRSIAFTDRLCELFGVNRAGLKGRIDRLFLACLAKFVEREKAVVGKKSVRRREVETEAAEIAERESKKVDFVPYAELLAEIAELLVSRAGMRDTAAGALAREIVDRSYYHLKFGQNRQNVLGEGFEDLLRILMVRIARVPEEKIALRKKADELPGFGGTPAQIRRVEKPDIAIVETRDTSLLSTVKWSLRHDRQKQLTDELDCYVQLRSKKSFPEYILVTNEYDPGRLKNSSNLSSRGKTVDRIYHINPSLVLEVLSDVPKSVRKK